MGSSDSSLSLSSCRDASVRTGLPGGVGDAGAEVGEDVEGDTGAGGERSPPDVVSEGEGDPISCEPSLDSFLTGSLPLLLPSPQRSLSHVGEEGVDGGGWCFLAFLLASLKLASGGRSLTPLRVEPSMAFCN